MSELTLFFRETLRPACAEEVVSAALGGRGLGGCVRARYRNGGLFNVSIACASSCQDVDRGAAFILSCRDAGGEQRHRKISALGYFNCLD